MVAKPGHEALEIDGLRGLAALIVFFSHASGLGLHLLPGLNLHGTGKSGVYLFFVISAFLLTRQWLELDAQRRFAAGQWGGYLLRRFLRIYPLYLVVLLVGWALAPRGLGVTLDGQAVLRHLLLQEGLGVYWSVAAEFKYYLLIPLMALWLSIPIEPLLRAIGVGSLIALVICMFPAQLAPDNGIDLGYYLPVFLCGSFAAWLRPGKASLPAWLQHWLELVALMVLLATVPAVQVAMGWDLGSDALHRSFLGWGLIWSALLLSVVGGWAPGWARALRWAPLRACGRWCFGIYLLHLPALYLAKRAPLPNSLKGLAGLALALFLASLSYRYLERPAIRLGARIGRNSS
ncbi:acyltransferase family protein [Paucibacter soli]|uniref:acyltransferase family protein n=1 Tax=Paucibacter soli TaxID=3133433 RepID=UPI00309C84D9